MSKNKENLYLFALNDEEVAEIYEALVIKDELKKRLDALHNEESPESPLLRKFASQFSDRMAHETREKALDNLDVYIDHEIDNEMMWQGIEEQLRRKFDE